VPEISSFFQNPDPSFSPFLHGTAGKVLIAIGCSWTRAWGWQDHDHQDQDRVDDVEFMLHKSYAGQVYQHLDCTGMINLAWPGSNNQTQIRLLMDVIEQHRDELGEIFVLWGITSHLRWELWSNIVHKPTQFMLGGDMPDHKEKERQWWLKYHHNEEFELKLLHQRILLLHGYLRNLGIDHLFFPTFTSYNRNNMPLTTMDHHCYYGINDDINDMLGLMYQSLHQPAPRNWISNPYDADDRAKVHLLKQAGLMSRQCHPSAMGHEFIAQNLVRHLSHR